MKIAILTPTFSQFSGIDRVVENEAKELYKEGNSVTIFCFKAKIKTKYAKVIEIGMPKNSTLERLYRLFFFIDIFKIKKVINFLKTFDKVICHQYPMTLIGSKAKNKFGISYTYHDAGIASPELFSNFLERFYMKLFKTFTIKTVRNADNAISISKFLSEVLEKETGLKSIVEYVKIDKERFKKGISGELIRTRFNLKDDPLCLYVGRLSPHKGVDLLIEAFNIVLKEIPIAKLLIVGKRTFGTYGNYLESLVKKVNKDSIIFTGFVKDEEMPLFYSAANLYTTASLWEGFDMPIVEAAACGKSSIAFDIGAHREVIKNGTLITKRDIKGFANAIISELSFKKKD